MPTETRPKLTKRQQQVLNYIRKHIEDYRFPPSFRDIAEAFGISGTAGVKCHVVALQRKGYLDWSPRIARSFTIID